jgi:K+-sensing histidine kinase KdpD
VRAGDLIHNAIKYSPKGTAISVSARITDAAELEFAVEYDGQTSRSESRADIRVILSQSRGEAVKRARPRAGTGHLPIVLARGGRMEVRDRPGGGACFVCSCPCASATTN